MTAHATGLRLPETLATFFAALRDSGTITAVRESGVTVLLPAADAADAEIQARRVGQRLGTTGHAPAFPTRPSYGGGWARVPSYRWEFDTPTYAGDGQWGILVPLTADLDHLLGVVSGLGEWARDYQGEPVLPVTLYPEDAADLVVLRTEIESELSAWFGEPVHLDA